MSYELYRIWKELYSSICLEGLRKASKHPRIATVLTEIIIQDLRNTKEWYCVDPSFRVFFE